NRPTRRQERVRSANITTYVATSALLPRGPPLAQGGLGGGGVLVTVLEAQVEEEAVGLADLAAGADAADLQDLVAVEVGAEGGELLLLGEPGDAGLEVVVGTPQPLGLAPVAGGAVGAGEDVQALELVAGVADVAADGGVGPLAAAVAVEAQVQLDEGGDGVDLVVGEAQRLHPLAGDLGADDVVVVEGDRAVVEEPPGARLADVVHERGEPGDEVRAVAEPVLE